MAINFPTNPNEGDTHNWQGISYKYDVTDDTWRRVHATYYVAEHEHDGRYYTETEIDNILSWRDQQLASGQLDTRYYTETESDARFVNVTGDTMTGDLEVPNVLVTTDLLVNGSARIDVDFVVGDDCTIQDNLNVDGWVTVAETSTFQDGVLINGNLNVATNASVAGNLSVTGWIRAVDDVYAYYGISSDARLKDNIVQIPDALRKVTSLHGVTFNYNKLAEPFVPDWDMDTKQVGVLAQEVNIVLPEAVRTRKDTEEEYMTVQYEKLVPLLIEAIKEQQEQITALQQRIDRLEE